MHKGPGGPGGIECKMKCYIESCIKVQVVLVEMNFKRSAI